MHELSIALSLIELACDKVRAVGDVRVEAVCIRVGRLSGVATEALSFCFDAAARGTAVEGARLHIEDVPLTIYCPQCAAERQLDSIQHLRCPVCEQPALDIVRGRELELAALEVSDCAAYR